MYEINKFITKPDLHAERTLLLPSVPIKYNKMNILKLELCKRMLIALPPPPPPPPPHRDVRLVCLCNVLVH